MARRNLTAGMLTALAEGRLRPVIFYEGEFVEVGSPSEVQAYLRLWSGIGELVWDSKTWTGGGGLVGISPIEETAELQASGFSATLTGANSELIATALNAVRQGRPGTIWFGLMDTSNALIADPYQLQRGLLDITVIEDDGEKSTISIQYESRLINLETPRVRYYTPEEQALDYASDQGFAFVASLQDKEIKWG